MTEEKTRILAIGDSIKLRTGYGKLNSQILGHFVQRRAEVLQIAWSHQEPPERLSVNDEAGRMVGAIGIVPPHTGDAFATESTITYVKGWKPHMLYVSNDYMVTEPLWDRSFNKGEYAMPFWAQYGIIDGPHCADYGYKSIIEACDCPVVPSRYGLKQIEKINKNVIYIPHGVDRRIFKPVPPEEKEQLKTRLGMGGKFVFGTVNRNIWRKQYPLLLQAFANLKYVHNIKDIALFINADPNDQFGNNLINWAKVLRLTISNDPTQPADLMFHRGNVNAVITVDELELARIYNSFDVFVSASMSEGFGLPTIEAQACGVPVIMCDNTANTELTQGHGWLYPTAKNIDGSPVILAPTFAQLTYFYEMPDAAAMEYTMLEAYNKDELRTSYGKLSYEFAKDYDWNRVLPMWDQVLERARNFKPRAISAPIKVPDQAQGEQQSMLQNLIAQIDAK